MTDATAHGPSRWAFVLARLIYAIAAVILLGIPLLSVVRATVGDCDAVPLVDGMPFVRCGPRAEFWPTAAFREVPHIPMVFGAFAAAAAAWVRSSRLVPGMLASIGIAIGCIAFCFPAVYLLAVMAYFGAGVLWSFQSVLMWSGLAIGLSSAAILWRGSARPWDRPPRRLL